MSACCHEAAGESGGKEEIVQAMASPQHFLEGQTLVTALFTAGIIIFLKGALDDAYVDFLLPDIAKAGIGHVREDFYERFYDIVLDDYNAELWSAYVVGGTLVAAIVDPHTKALEGLS